LDLLDNIATLTASGFSSVRHGELFAICRSGVRDGSVLPITADIGVLAAVVETSLFAIGGRDIKATQATTRLVRIVPQLVVGYTGEVEAADEKAAGT